MQTNSRYCFPPQIMLPGIFSKKSQYMITIRSVKFCQNNQSSGAQYIILVKISQL